MGILIRGFEILELICFVDMVVLDKMGIVIIGWMVLVDVLLVLGEDWVEVLYWFGVLEVVVEYLIVWVIVVVVEYVLVGGMLFLVILFLVLFGLGVHGVVEGWELVVG